MLLHVAIFNNLQVERETILFTSHQQVCNYQSAVSRNHLILQFRFIILYLQLHQLVQCSLG